MNRQIRVPSYFPAGEQRLINSVTGNWEAAFVGAIFSLLLICAPAPQAAVTLAGLQRLGARFLWLLEGLGAGLAAEGSWGPGMWR